MIVMLQKNFNSTFLINLYFKNTNFAAFLWYFFLQFLVLLRGKNFEKFTESNIFVLRKIRGEVDSGTLPFFSQSHT